MKGLALVAAVSALVSQVTAVAVYGQCGGIGYTGSTTCDAGSTCVVSNQYYSQCLPSSTAPTSTVNVPTTTSSGTGSTPGPAGCSGTRTKFRFFGVNESGAEFGNTVIPGTLGKDYTWPSPSSVDFFMSKGFNTFRVTFLMERLTPGSITASFNQAYLSGLKTIVSYITSKGGFAVVDPHNYMRFNNAVISSTSQFQTFWQNLAGQFANDTHVIFDVMNEPHDIDASTVASLNQAAINGIRASGATSQLILAEGTAWTGAWSWTTSGNSQAFTGLKDPNNNLAIQMHQYLDSDSSGTSTTCVSSTIGAERLANATAWLKQNNLKGFLGEIGAGSNSVCISAVQGALCSMQQSGVWLGALWWAAGPWWGTYFQSIEPPSGAAVSQILPQALMPFL